MKKAKNEQITDLALLPLTKRVLAMNGGYCGLGGVSKNEKELAQLRKMVTRG